MGMFAVLGLFQVVLYWHGLVDWVRICSLPYSEIKGTPYEELWTSLRAVGGVLFLTIALVWFIAHPRSKGIIETPRITEPNAGDNRP
jgi:hypothetical protein